MKKRPDKYETIFKRLKRLIPDLETLDVGAHRKFENEPYMPLHLDVLERKMGEKSGSQYVRISLSHTYLQNGDVMADPDMEIRVWLDEGWQRAEALTFQQDGLGIYQQVYPDPQHVDLRLKRQLNDFLLTWLNNIRKQEFRQVDS